MKIREPAYYRSFHCLAGNCPDTCCQAWDIQVDPNTAARYAAVSGPLGEALRTHLHLEDGDTVITLGEDGVCPMLRRDGLCRIQADLGEEALCQVCRDFPRLRHDYGDFLELGLEMSCPEAARILLTAPAGPDLLRDAPDSGEPDYDHEAMTVLTATRESALSLLCDESRPLAETFALLFFYGCHVQALLDGEEAPAFDPEEALETARALTKPAELRPILDFFLELDILTDTWQNLLKGVHAPALSPLCRNLAKYLVRRYWLQAVADYDLYCRVKFILISCILVGSLGGDFIDTAHLWSKEIENDADNMDAILDAAYESLIFTDDKILGLFLQNSQNPPL